MFNRFGSASDERMTGSSTEEREEGSNAGDNLALL